MGQFRQTCKPFRNRNYSINLSSWDPIFRTLEARYLVIVIVKYNEKIYDAKPVTILSLGSQATGNDSCFPIVSKSSSL